MNPLVITMLSQKKLNNYGVESRQPRAIKRTTLTALQNEGIYIAKHFHWNTTVKPMMLRACYIRNILYIHDRFDHGTNIFGVHFTRYLCEFTAFLARH